MKKVFIIVLFSFMHLLSYAYEIKVDTVIVDYNNSRIEQIIVTINHTGADTLWIWFDNKRVENEGHYIKKYLMKRSCEECFSFFDIATDPNMDGCWWKAPTSIQLFIKCLMSHQTFTIVIYKEKEHDVCTNNSTNEWHDIIKIFKQEDIIKYCPGIDTPYGIKRISYPYSTIVYTRHVREH